MLHTEISQEEYTKQIKEFYSIKKETKKQMDKTLQFSEGIYIEIYDKEYLQDPTTKVIDGSEFQEWVKIDIPPMFGKQVSDFNETGILIGFAYSFVDYYYIIILPNEGKVVYWSCVGKIELVK